MAIKSKTVNIAAHFRITFHLTTAEGTITFHLTTAEGTMTSHRTTAEGTTTLSTMESPNNGHCVDSTGARNIFQNYYRQCHVPLTVTVHILTLFGFGAS